MADFRDVAAWCERADASAFPLPRGCAFLPKNEVELNAIFAMETREAWLRNLKKYLNEQAA